MYGENTSPDKTEQYVIYIIFTVFVNIVMLNLLISIIGDTFEKQMAIQQSEELKEVCSILIEIGQTKRLLRKLCCRNPRKVQPKYLHFLGKTSGAESGEQEWQGRVQVLRQHMDDGFARV